VNPCDLTRVSVGKDEEETGTGASGIAVEVSHSKASKLAVAAARHQSSLYERSKRRLACITEAQAF
jgi:hypothetical protein